MASAISTQIYEMSNVVIPKNALIDSIRETYEGLPKSVQCGFSSCRALHRKGCVVSFKSNDEPNLKYSIMGHICGKKHFQNWEEVNLTYEKTKRELDKKINNDIFINKSRKYKNVLIDINSDLIILTKIIEKIIKYDKDFLYKIRSLFNSNFHHDITGKDFFLTKQPANIEFVLKIFDEIEILYSNSEKNYMKISEVIAKYPNIFSKLDELINWIKLGKKSLTSSNMESVITLMEKTNFKIHDRTLIHIQRSYFNKPDIETKVVRLL